MFLNIPIRVEGLFLDSPKQVASPLADFSKLPWNDGTQDYNFSQPFVGDGIVHQPFGSQNLMLGKGLHLHFIIPHYLGQHIPKIAGLTDSEQLANVGKLPPAPNRWLITRTDKDGTKKQWIIDSDFIHMDENYVPEEPTCIIPFPNGRPYRYMGLKTTQSQSNLTVENLAAPNTRQTGSYFKQLNNKQGLSVIGFGDINFSAFYPNCLGVFGFYDPDADSSKKPSYEIRGINYHQEDDLLNQFIPKLFQTGEQQTQKDSNFQFDIKTALKNSLKLQLDSSTSIQSSDTIQSVFTGSFSLDSTELPKLDSSTLQIAIGNNSTEALSALMAKQINPDQKRIVEDQLESILLFSKLDHLTADTGPKFLEARHEKGFRSSISGAQWKIISTSNSKKTSLTEAEVDEINPNYITKLNELNALKHQYDKNRDELRHLREQLYLDWYKYMLAAYPPLEGRGQFPDPDHIRYFIETYSFPEIDKLIDETGELKISDKSNGFTPSFVNPKPDPNKHSDPTKLPDPLAKQISDKWTDLNKLIQSSNNSSDSTTLSLALDNGKEYWEPTDPCILISGLPDISHNDVYNDNGCLTIGINSTENTFSMSSQKWTPFILDWEVDLKNSTFLKPGKPIAPEGMKNTFNLDQLGPDFIESEGSGKLSVFSGSVMMSQHSKGSMLKHIEEFFESIFKQNKIEFKDKPKPKKSSSNSTKVKPEKYTLDNLWSNSYENVKTALGTVTDASDDIITQFTSSNTKDTPTAVETAWQAYKKVNSYELITQTLNGFNETCVMKRKTAQLPIREPIGFENDKLFTEQVNTRVSYHQTVSPMVRFDFNPIRSGNMTLNRLRLIDNFGIGDTISINDMSISQPLKGPSTTIALKPRLTQAARLNFDWIHRNSSSSDNPICGWLMANYWDNSISVFDNTGLPLGSISQDVMWNLPPWNTNSPNLSNDIADSTLSFVVNWIINNASSSKKSIEDFVAATQSALNNIAPTNAHLYDIKAILMGRPMAVVKASLSFSLKELPVIDQSWSSLLYDLSNCDKIPGYSHKDRLNKDWTDIKLPVRLGEHRQLNDGLVGYWLTNDLISAKQGNSSATFISPEADASAISGNDSALGLYKSGSFETKWLPLTGGSLEVTMLVDPRGVIHATTGILPAKSIQIDTKYYLDVIKKLNMWFKVSPILQPQTMNTRGVSLNLPPIPGTSWNWWDADNTPSTIKPDGKSSNIQVPTQLVSGWLNLKETKKPN